jgi:hypothetical protein
VFLYTQQQAKDKTMTSLKDGRYTITREWTGKDEPQYVVRFCGDWVDSRSTKGAALMRAVGYQAERNGALVIEAVD